MRFETRYTYDFVKRFLPGDYCRILEVGCGAGELAAALSRDGHTVIAFDSDPESIASARRRSWPNFDDGQFNAVLFTRSLHHIHPLDESARHAVESVVEGGCIIVEDFAYESVAEKKLGGLHSLIALVEA